MGSRYNSALKAQFAQMTTGLLV